MRCLACGFVMPAAQKFCGECGVRLDVVLPDTAVPDRSYTPPHLAQKILLTRSALEGERKLVTVLFCDIAESTPLSDRIGPDRMHKVLNAFFEVTLAEVHRYEGTVNQFLGDGFMALFGAPIAHEDHARRGALAAMAIRKAVTSDARLQAPDIALKTRIGLNTGPVVVGRIGDNLRMDYTAIGDTTNVAARIQSLSDPDTILASDAVVRASNEHLEYQSIGLRALKGKPDPIALHELIRGRAHRVRRNTHADTVLIGRDAEMQTIHRSLEALQDRQGGAIAIVGEAGLGKSRLVEFALQRARELGLRVARGSCLSFGRTLSYWPFREVIREVFDIDDGDGEAATWAKLHVGSARLLNVLAEELLPYIATLIALPLPELMESRVRSLDGSAMGHQVFRTALLLFERIAEDTPTIVVLEDWHWADASSAELLQHLLPLVDRVPLCFLSATRPEQQGAAAGLLTAVGGAQSRARRCTTITLTPLSRGQSLQLSEHLLGGGALPSQLRDMLQRRSGGNPFYLGELVRALIVTEGIERDALTGEWQVTERYDAVPLPDTIEGVILARIDRLEDEAKQVLKEAAVVGRTFLYRVLRAVAVSAELDDDLTRLRDAGLIEQKRATPELELLFQHPLIHQATYDSLISDHRRALHLRIARAIELLFSERLEEFLSILAHHYAQAEDWEHAFDYLFRAGDQAGRIAADAEALDHYERALQASRSSTRALTSLQLAELDRRIGEALFRLGQHGSALEHLFAALSRLGVSYPKSQRGVGAAIALKLLKRAVRGAKRHLFGSKGRPTVPPSPEVVSATQAIEAAAAIDFFRNSSRYFLGVLVGLELAEAHSPTRALVVHTSALAQVFDSLGFTRVAGAYHAKSRRAAESLGDDNALGYCLLLKGMHEHVVGDWVGARRCLEGAVQHFRAGGHLHNQCAALIIEMIVLRTRGEPKWLELVDEVVALSTESQDEQAIAWAKASAGMRSLHRGDFAAAVIAYEDACARLEEIRDLRSLAHGLARLALCEAKLGRLRAAIEHLEKSEQVRNGQRLDPMFEAMATAPAAEAYLCLAEQSSEVEMRRDLLRRAMRACDRLSLIGRRILDESAPEALRLRGTHRWLLGDRDSAVTLWRRGIKVAEEVRAMHVLAKLHHEIGLRTDDAVHARMANELFALTGAVSASV